MIPADGTVPQCQQVTPEGLVQVMVQKGHLKAGSGSCVAPRNVDAPNIATGSQSRRSPTGLLF